MADIPYNPRFAQGFFEIDHKTTEREAAAGTFANSVERATARTIDDVKKHLDRLLSSQIAAAYPPTLPPFFTTTLKFTPRPPPVVPLFDEHAFPRTYRGTFEPAALRCARCDEPEHNGRRMFTTAAHTRFCGDCLADGVPLAKQPVKEVRPPHAGYHAWATPAWEDLG